MRVLITGAGGFLGRRLTTALLRRGRLAEAPITALHLADLSPVAPPARQTLPVQSEYGDLSDPEFMSHLVRQGFDSIFHLAASLTLEAERDAEAAFATNIAPLRRMIAGPGRPRIVFASSIAVFGGKLPETVDDCVRPSPETTYGTHKAIAELLLADHSRRGDIDGRALRLPIVLIRPGAPSPAVSDQVAAILREPLAGRDVACLLAPETRMPVASAGAVVAALIRLHDLPAAALPPGRVMNLPALTVSVTEMVEAVARHAGPEATRHIRFAPDAVTQSIVDAWPRRFASTAAEKLEICSDPDLDTIIAEYLTESADHG
ncbi:NAD-dependent epimerase/dehydratase family protein [Pseudoroseomonas wenyumeiae]|uniref:NAD-dependent epimerase/dehydratase family protein n=1 Tax=Teichococcus wenyumeiae TaxID=2478470 RepID=A0A3A9JET1_9PROT|nr:NAD-dependent epimerase/dehydratase family protein [Pseudoroseomonas wenyumeiae]RKK02126.1 NAD-dependent epimerase/dehydratase family protein [Pseudoroseomonas wenyumeiae]RMI15493.1 NAD-dependent epimerase/dehydratase family protein [Pseudoroseomonas wenyumeiae]